MKKLFIVSLAAIMCLALALPAVAEVKMSGGVNFMAYYLVGSPETNQDSHTTLPFGGGTYPGFIDEGTSADIANWGNVNNIDGRKSTQMNLSNLLTTIRATYTNAKGTYGATMGIVGGQINNYVTNWEMGLDATYMWWMIMPNVKVSIGKISQFIGGLGPSSLIEHSEYERAANAEGNYPNVITGTPVAGLTSYGNMSTTSIPGVSFDIKVNDMVSVILGIYDPDNDGAPDITLSPAVVNGTTLTVDEDTVIPRLDIAIPIKWGNFYVQPVASYLKKSFSGVSASCDSDETIWLIGASGSVKLGPVTLSGEYVHGRNIGDANYSGPGSTSATGTPSTYTVNNVTQIGDITDNAWWVQVRWQATPQIAVQAAYGQWVGTGDHNPAVATDDREYKRSGFVANLWYSIGPNFFVIPSYSHLNMGSDVNLHYDEAYGISPAARWSFGTVDLYGVAFYMIF